MDIAFAKYNHTIRESSPQPRSEYASNSIHRPCSLNNNVDNVFPPSPVSMPSSHDKPQVILIDAQRKEVAKGYIVTDSTAQICHGRLIGIGEKKVHIDEVLEPDAPLIYPQGETFSSYVAGGYLMWFEAWLKSI